MKLPVSVPAAVIPHTARLPIVRNSSVRSWMSENAERESRRSARLPHTGDVASLEGTLVCKTAEMTSAVMV
jgi:hypothetical protein